MAIDVGGLFAQLGTLAGGLNEWNAARGATLLSRWADLVAVYAGDEEGLDGLYAALLSAQTAGGGWASTLARYAQDTLIRTVNADQLQEDASLAEAVRELIAQMIDQGESVGQVTLGVAVTAGGSNVGNPVWVTSTKYPDGTSCVYLFEEELTAECIADGQPGGGASAGRETIRVRGEQAALDARAPDWPKGSGGVVALSVVDPSQDAQGGFGQALRNGDWADWDEDSSSGTGEPLHWTVRVGTLASHYAHESSSGYDEPNALTLIGDGSTLTRLDQTFGSTTGTPVRLEPLQQYALALRTKVTSVPAAGVLRVALVDGSGTVLDDEQGTANSLAIDLTGETTSFAAHVAVFRTPRVLPATVRLELRLTTALSVGSNAVVDQIGFARMRPLYLGGPSVAVFAGDTDLVRQDAWTITATNNATDTSWHRAADRLLGLRNLGLVLPDSGSPTISHTLIG